MELLIALIGVLIAAAALVYAAQAKRIAEDTLELARDEVRIAREEHEVFLKELRARAVLDVGLRVANYPVAPDGAVEVEATSCFPRIEIGITNRGDKAARDVILNALVPAHTQAVRWAAAGGQEIPAGGVTLPTAETLDHPDGGPQAAIYLEKTLSRVSRRPNGHVVYFQLHADIPHQGEAAIPIRVRVDCDDLPDDQADVTIDMLLRLRRPRGDGRSFGAYDRTR